MFTIVQNLTEEVNMLHSISGCVDAGCAFFEKGLSHPTFFGRAVSWGIFYGTLAIIVKKVFDYAYPKIRDYWTSMNQCKCQHDTPGGEVILTDSKRTVEKPKNEDLSSQKPKASEPPPTEIVSPDKQAGECEESQKKKEN